MNAATILAKTPALIVSEKDFPKSGPNYFNNSDVRPYTDGDAIFVYNGRSGRHCSVRSTVTTLAADVVAIEVVGWHKFTARGPVSGSYYFVRDPEIGIWVRRTANHKRVREALR